MKVFFYYNHYILMNKINEPRCNKMASPLLAAIFSVIIPGLGQFYAGHMLRGIGIFILAVFVGIITGLIGSPLIAIVAAIDAYYLASKAD